MQHKVQALAEQGWRVLGVARARWEAAAPPEDLRQCRFEWLGLLAFEDPLRPSAAQAVAQARGAGIAVLMITGDHAHTALAIAAQAGIDTTGGVLTGAQLQRLGDAQLSQAVARVRVFARVQPEQKLRLVQALRARGEVVAMTGDGVNDAPALKAAHIGIAMGARGTDVAREAAAVVLLDEDFGHIVAGIRMGRRIADNLRKVMTYITAIHVPIAGLAVLPLLLGWPPMLLPAHVVLMEMIIDPVCALAFEGAPAAPGLMQQPPRRADEPLIGWPMLRRGALQGLCVLLLVLAVYGVAVQGPHPEEARGLALVALTVGNLGLVWLNASLGVGWRAVFGKGYRAFWWVSAAASLALALSFALPALRDLLGLSVPSVQGLGAALLMGALGVALAALVSRIGAPGSASGQEKTA
jgi:Ca2+-transporting ATPase